MEKDRQARPITARDRSARHDQNLAVPDTHSGFVSQILDDRDHTRDRSVGLGLAHSNTPWTDAELQFFSRTDQLLYRRRDWENKVGIRNDEAARIWHHGPEDIHGRLAQKTSHEFICWMIEHLQRCIELL